MVSQNDKIDSKSPMKLGNFSLPPLAAGKYTLDSSILLKAIDQQGDRNGPAQDVVLDNQEKLVFFVAAPQLSLDPALIYQVYPPPSTSGAFHNTCPHIVFTRKTLPWERQIDGIGSDAAPCPWMALLLLSTEEISNSANAIQFQQIPADAVAQTTTALWAPHIQLGPSAASIEKVNVVEMSKAFFESIAPDVAELPFLTHIRQVDTSNKANTAVNPKGWFSVLIGNRLPQDDAENTVVLVSLEGHQDLLTNPSSVQQANVRLVVLHRWAFDSAGNTMAELVEQLEQNIQPYKLDEAFFKPADIRGKPVETAIQFGYTAMNLQWRNGTKSPAWFQGPFIPATKAIASPFSYKSADEALRFDDPTGILDIAHASAWQLGRLLALGHPSFFASINAWKTNYENKNTLQAAHEILGTSDANRTWEMAEDEVLAKRQAAETDEVLLNYLIEIWD